MTDQFETILRGPRVQHASGHGRSTLYRHIATGLWTRPVRLGPRSVGWPSSEVRAINAARVAGRTDDEIRELVAKLHKEREASPADPREGRL